MSGSTVALMLLFISGITVAAAQSMPAATIALCSKFPFISGPDTQSYTMQCATGNIPAGSVSEVIINWGAGVLRDTIIKGRRLVVQVQGHPYDDPKGRDQLTVSGYLTQNSSYIPTCITKTKLAVANDQTVQVTMTYPTRQTPPKTAGQQGTFKCVKPFNPLPVAIATQPTQPDITEYTPSTSQLVGTPTGLRLQVSCKAGASKGTCSALITLTANFKGLILDDQNADAVGVSYEMTRQTGLFICPLMLWFDQLNVLGRGAVQTDIGVCQVPYIPGTPGSAGINAPSKPWDTTIIGKAVRAARYAAAIHGCLPEQPYRVTVKDNRGVSRTYSGTRTWEGTNGIASWGGGPDTKFQDQRNPACLSCFKDGIVWSNNLKPKGFQLQGTLQFADAAIVFTDSAISGEDPAKLSTVVLFRATATALTSRTWISNLLFCGPFNIGGSSQPFNDTTFVADAGTVCSGWRKPVLDLVGLGLLNEVKRRVNSAKAADRSVYVIGHSRGGALATVFAAWLIREQQTGGLLPPDGPLNEQIKLYTYGSPRVGNRNFTAYLEKNMYERYRVVNRFDGVPTFPEEGENFVHFRPSVWFRGPDGNDTKADRGCVLVEKDKLSANEQRCYVSCNQALICNYGAGVTVPGTPGNDPADCRKFSDAENIVESAGTAVKPGAVTLIDHMSYMGIDVNNGGCSYDVSMINALTPNTGLAGLFGTCGAKF